MEIKPKNPGINAILRLEWLLPVLFAYFLGFSLVRYLSGELDLVNFVLGFVICVLIPEMRYFLGAYFDHPESQQSSLKQDDPVRTHLKKYKRALLLQYTLLILTAGAVLTMVLIQRRAVSGPVLVFLGLALVVNFFASAPPLRLEKLGYGELIESVYTIILVPAIAFSLQQSDISLLLVFLTLPLALIYLAMKIALSFRDYGSDLALNHKSLAVQMGWQKALKLHNLLIIGAYLLLGVFSLISLPWSFTRVLVISLPLGALQIFLMLRIADGERPRWALLRWTVVGFCAIFCYLVIITLWLN